MSIILHTKSYDDNVHIKNTIYRIVLNQMSFVGSTPTWILDSEDRLTLSAPRYRDKAAFRIHAYPGIVTFELHDPADTNTFLPFMDAATYTVYHDAMMDFIYQYFCGSFTLAERTPYVRRGPSLDIPLMERGH